MHRLFRHWTLELVLITPTRSNVLVKMIPYLDQIQNKLKLTLVDNEKHWRHATRKGTVIATGPYVQDLSAGMVIYMKGSSGKTLDGRDAGYGEEYRWLKESDALAYEVPA